MVYIVIVELVSLLIMMTTPTKEPLGAVEAGQKCELLPHA